MTQISESARRLKVMIEKAIADHRITRDEMDAILAIATEDSHIDPHEQALLNQLQEMIENKVVKVVAS
jgi:tellurite resistance protein